MSYGHEVFGLAAVTRPVRLATSSRQCSRLMAISLRELPPRSLAMDTRCGSFLASHEFRSLLGVREQMVLVDPASKLVWCTLLFAKCRQIAPQTLRQSRCGSWWLPGWANDQGAPTGSYLIGWSAGLPRARRHQSPAFARKLIMSMHRRPSRQLPLFGRKSRQCSARILWENRTGQAAPAGRHKCP
jgi:hypothetical protein